MKDVFGFLETYKYGKKCCRNVRWKQSVQQFEQALLRITAVNCQALCKHKYRFHGYTHFNLRERGKVRPIDAPRVQDRQIEKVFTKKVLLPLYEPSMIYNNGASLEGKGFHFSQKMLVRDLQRHFKKYGRQGGIILTDARHFFPSANHDYLFKRHNKLILNQELREFAGKIVDSAPNPEGMPLGVEPSQVEMIAYPSEMDNYLCCQYGLTGGHYMDDFYYIVPPGVDYKEVIKVLKEQAKKNCLTLHPDKTRYVPLTHPFRFCKIKYILTETGKVIKRANQKTMGRDRKKIKALHKKIQNNEMSYEDLWTSVNGMMAYLNNYTEHEHILQLRRYFYKLFGFSCENIQEFRKRDETMKYLTMRRFKRNGIGGDFNIPYGTILEKKADGILYLDDKPVCVARSAASHLHFVNDSDGNGAKRYYWTSSIIKKLDGNVRSTVADARDEEKEHSRFWEIITKNEIAQKYRRVDQEDYWLWDDTFYNDASIADLEYIGSLIDIKDGGN